MSKLTGDDFSRLIIVTRLVDAGERAENEIREWRAKSAQTVRGGMDTRFGEQLMAAVMDPDQQQSQLDEELRAELDVIRSYAGVKNR